MGPILRLRRTDFELAEACEPYVHVYADPPQHVRIGPVPPLEWRHTVAEGPDGWEGVAEPDGRVVVDGVRHDGLLWEGRSGWLPPPRTGYVVRGDEVEALLAGLAPTLGLEGREADAFVAAWTGALAPASWVRVGLHDQATIDEHFPLDVSPRPDAVLRVLLDASLLDAPVGVPPPHLLPVRVDRAGGLVLVEWGGVVRDRRR